MLLLKGEGGYRGPFLEITGSFSGRNQLLELLRLFPHSCKQRHQLKLGVTKSVALQLFKTSYLIGPYVSLLFFFSGEVSLLTLFVHCFPKQYRKVLWQLCCNVARQNIVICTKLSIEASTSIHCLVYLTCSRLRVREIKKVRTRK